MQNIMQAQCVHISAGVALPTWAPAAAAVVGTMGGAFFGMEFIKTVTLPEVVMLTVLAGVLAGYSTSANME